MSSVNHLNKQNKQSPLAVFFPAYYVPSQSAKKPSFGPRDPVDLTNTHSQNKMLTEHTKGPLRKWDNGADAT